MSRLLFKRSLVVGASLAVILVMVLAFNVTSPAYAFLCTGFCAPRPTDAPPTATPENGGRVCAISKIVGYKQPGGEQQFYFVDGGVSRKIGSFSGEAMAAFLAGAVGKQVTLKTPSGPLTLTNQGSYVFTVKFNGADAICNRSDLK